MEIIENNLEKVDFPVYSDHGIHIVRNSREVLFNGVGFVGIETVQDVVIRTWDEKKSEMLRKLMIYCYQFVFNFEVTLNLNSQTSDNIVPAIFPTILLIFSMYHDVINILNLYCHTIVVINFKH